jgi:4-hydroxy-3-methylbut-2-enyl diphosphate reductase
MPEIEKTGTTGFCFGVRRAVEMLESIARERGGIETLGDIVHNRQVVERLENLGVRVVRDIDDIVGDTVVTTSHGISPQMAHDIRSRGKEIVSTTCPNVQRAQNAAKELAEAGFFVLIFGDGAHPEVKGIMGYAGEQCLASVHIEDVAHLVPAPKKIGILAQTTQVPMNFLTFVKRVIDLALAMNSEIRIIDTICHDLRQRQPDALELARRSDLMLVVGGRSSANTTRLAELCSLETETHHIETADDIDPAWLKGKKHIGVTSGASTADETVDEVIRRLEEIACLPSTGPDSAD